MSRLTVLPNEQDLKRAEALIGRLAHELDAYDIACELAAVRQDALEEAAVEAESEWETGVSDSPAMRIRALKGKPFP